MAITKTLGGDRIGTGKKMQVRMHNFERSTHNLSRDWKSSMTVGTLIPCFNEIGLPGDSFDIDIESIVKTQPTTGPLFGSFKMQVDFYSCPIRLYNAALHNNMLGVGLKMSEIKLPKVAVKGGKCASSSLNAYLGIRGNFASVDKLFNGVRHVAYYDIFKNYYSNKQEPNAYYITAKVINENIASLSFAFGSENIALTKTPDGFMGMENPEQFNASTFSGLTLTLSNNYTWREFKEYAGKTDTALGFLPTGEINHLLISWSKLVRLTDSDYAYFTDTHNPSNPVSHNNFQLVINDKAEFWRQCGYTGNDYTKLTFSEIVTQTKIFDNIRGSLDLGSFRLDVIDRMREYILTTGKTSIQIGTLDGWKEQPYISCYQDAKFELGGICVKTYLSDVFNNWLNSESIIGDNGIAAITAVDTSSGSFTIDSLILANKVYNMLNRIAVSGGTYDDWQEVVYGEDLSFRAESPIYLGGMSREIYFEEVVSTSDATAEGSEVPLGSIAGKGKQSDKKGGSVSFRVNEPSVIMGIVSLTPRIDYSQGNDWFMYLDNIDDLHKPSLDGIGFQDLMMRQMLYSAPDTKAVGKQPAWINYMTSYNQNFGDFATGGSLEHMVLNRNYSNSGDVTTYIDPRKYNYIFADNAIDAQNFWVQLGFRCTARRKMSAKVMPNL